MNNHRLVIANWKMQLSLAQSLHFCTESTLQKLSSYAQRVDSVLCPSFPALHPMSARLKKSSVALGAQDCSAHAAGAFTGQTSAAMLAEIGVQYCIVGHCERRQLCAETDTLVAHKVEQLLCNAITPIICIGETLHEYQNGITTGLLHQQLESIRPAVSAQHRTPLCIAYEPVWAIGTGLSADIPYIQTIIAWIKEYVSTHGMTARIVYGGSVQPDNCAAIAQIPHLDGVLVGSASLDFQKFEKIVSCFHAQ